MKAQGGLDLLQVSIGGHRQSFTNCELWGSLSKEDMRVLVGGGKLSIL